MNRINASDEQEIIDQEIPDRGSILDGSVGWPGDSVVEDTSGPMTFIKVTLHEGHPFDKPVSEEGFANGYKILARLSEPFFRIPPKGKAVVVAIPARRKEVPGAALIIGIPNNSPTRQFGANTAVLDFGTQNVVIKGKTVTLYSEDGDVRSTVAALVGKVQCQVNGSGLYISPDNKVAIKCIDNDGNIKSQVLLTEDSVQLLDATGNGSIKLKGGDFSGQGTNMNCFYGSIGLGRFPSPATPVVVGVSGQSGIGSSSIFGSP
jgi:hypothetical protein